jgi:hypothetical protein
LADLKSLKTNIKIDNEELPHLPYWLMTARFGELVNEVFIKWSRESVALLGKMND